MAQAEISKRNVAVWFEIPSRDFTRAKRFYETVFAVQLSDERMGDHVLGVFPYSGDAVSGCVMSGPGYAPAGDGAGHSPAGGRAAADVLHDGDHDDDRALRNRLHLQ